MNVRMFISEVKKRRALWDYTSKNYNNKKMLSDGWKEIGKIFSVEVSVAKQKWKNLRDTYRVELKKTKKYSTMDDPTSLSRNIWAYYKDMSFIRHVLRTRKLGGLDQAPKPIVGVESEESLNDNIKIEPEITLSPIMLSEDHDAQDDTTSLMIENVTSLQPDFDVADTTQGRRGTKRKVHDDDNHDDEDQDDNMLFFRSLLPFVKRLDQDKKLLFRMNVQQMLYDQLYN